MPDPVNTVAPSVSGSPTVGQTLFCSTGTWTLGANQFAYQWQLETGVGTGVYANIAAATASSYRLIQADLGLRVRCVVTATVVAGGTALLGINPNSGFNTTWQTRAATLGAKIIRSDDIQQLSIDWASQNGAQFMGLAEPVTLSIVNTYPSITLWEIDNEPYFPSDANVLPAWAATARNNAAAIKGAHPGHTLLLPMLVQANNGDYSTGGVFSPWANQVFAAQPDIGSFYDAWSAHPYPSPSGGAPNLTVLDNVHTQLVALGFNKPCYITEVGWSTGTGSGQVTEAAQSSNISSLITAARTRAWVAGIVIYSLQSFDSSFEGSFGIYRADGTEKPAVATFRSLA